MTIRWKLEALQRSAMLIRYYTEAIWLNTLPWKLSVILDVHDSVLLDGQMPVHSNVCFGTNDHWCKREMQFTLLLQPI